MKIVMYCYICMAELWGNYVIIWICHFYYALKPAEWSKGIFIFESEWIRSGARPHPFQLLLLLLLFSRLCAITPPAMWGDCRHRYGNVCRSLCWCNDSWQRCHGGIFALISSFHNHSTTVTDSTLDEEQLLDVRTLILWCRWTRILIWLISSTIRLQHLLSSEST